MQELIKVTEENGEQLVSARDLHDFLESKQDFTTWIKSRVEKYGFLENEDFTFHKFMVGKSIAHDYILKIDMAKELSMVEGNEKGSLARRYFLNCEKKLKEVLPQLTEMEMIVKIANNSLIQDKKIIAIEAKVDSVINTVTIDSLKQSILQKSINRRVYFLFYNYPKVSAENLYEQIKIEKDLKSKMFRNIHNDIRKKFGVPSYRDVKNVEYDKALEFINSWIADKEVI